MTTYNAFSYFFAIRPPTAATIALRGTDIDCGEGDAYQVNIQKSLDVAVESSESSIQLLEETPEGDPGHDAKLNRLVKEVNRFFETKAKALLLAKREALEDTAAALRLEVTVLLTDRGLQLAYSHALPVKVSAPPPRRNKGLFDRFKGRKTFTPGTTAAKVETRTGTTKLKVTKPRKRTVP